MRQLLLQFLWLFLKMSIIGSLVITLDNILSGANFWDLLIINLKLIGGQILAFVGIFLSVLWYLLRPVAPYFGTGVTAHEVFSRQEIETLGIRYLRLPFNFFSGFLLFAIIAAILFHILQDLIFWKEWDWTDFLASFTFEQTLSWLLALMLYNGTRRNLRPLYSWLAESAPMGLGVNMSFRKRVLGMILALTVMMGMDYASFLFNIDESGKYVWNLAGFFLLFLSISYFFARSAIDDTVNDIDQVRTSLADFNRLEFPYSIQRLQVQSADEVGDLKVQFNSLQEKAEKYFLKLSQEWKLAYRVQASLLPKAPLLYKAVTVKGKSVFAEDLGGDFFDYALMDEKTAVLLIGDVSGKGIPAALVASTVLGLFRAEIRHGGTPAELLQRINGSISEILIPGTFVSAGILIIDVVKGHYQYASAGHLPPIQISDNEIQEWETTSLPLGFGALEPVAVRTGELSEGDRVVFYTDGVLEAKSDSGEFVGFERLHNWVKDCAAFSTDIMQELTDFLETFRSGFSRQDDETLMVLQFDSRQDTGFNGNSTVSQSIVQ